MSSVDFVRNAEEHDMIAVMECSHWEQLHRSVFSQAELRAKMKAGMHYCSNPDCKQERKAVFFAPAEETNHEWLLLNRF